MKFESNARRTLSISFLILSFVTDALGRNFQHVRTIAQNNGQYSQLNPRQNVHIDQNNNRFLANNIKEAERFRRNNVHIQPIPVGSIRNEHSISSGVQKASPIATYSEVSSANPIPDYIIQLLNLNRESFNNPLRFESTRLKPNRENNDSNRGYFLPHSSFISTVDEPQNIDHPQIVFNDINQLQTDNIQDSNAGTNDEYVEINSFNTHNFADSVHDSNFQNNEFNLDDANSYIDNSNSQDAIVQQDNYINPAFPNVDASYSEITNQIYPYNNINEIENFVDLPYERNEYNVHIQNENNERLIKIIPLSDSPKLQRNEYNVHIQNENNGRLIKIIPLSDSSELQRLQNLPSGQSRPSFENNRPLIKIIPLPDSSKLQRLQNLPNRHSQPSFENNRPLIKIISLPDSSKLQRLQNLPNGHLKPEHYVSSKLSDGQNKEINTQFFYPPFDTFNREKKEVLSGNQSNSANSVVVGDGFVPSYFGKSMVEIEKALPQGRSLNGGIFDEGGGTFVSGKLEGGFIPSTNFNI